MELPAGLLGVGFRVEGLEFRGSGLKGFRDRGRGALQGGGLSLEFRGLGLEGLRV